VSTREGQGRASSRWNGSKTQLGRGGSDDEELLGAAIKEGSVVLTDLSMPQLAAVLRVSSTYIGAALGMSPPERAAVHRGLRCLVEPRPKASVRTRLAKIVGEIGIDAARSLLAAGEQKNAA